MSVSVVVVVAFSRDRVRHHERVIARRGRYRARRE